MELVIDERERKVIPDIQGAVRNYPVHAKTLIPLTSRVATIPQGDYVLNYEGRLMAVIERKTHKDYAASMKDGRSDNKEKMLLLARTAGPHVRVYYIVEGPLSRALDADVAGIAWKSILASMERLSLLDGIHVIRTSNAADTGARLCFLAETIANAVADGLLTFEGGAEYAVAAAASKIPKSDQHKVVDMWMGIRGVGRASANRFVSAFSIAQAYALANAADPSLHKALRNANWEAALAAAHGFSAATVPSVVEAMTLEPEALARALTSKGKPVGKKRAAELHRLLHWTLTS